MLDRPEARGLTSGRVCEIAGISRGALRLYEAEGLLPPAPRSQGGYRLYPDETVDLIEAIKLLKCLGFALAETREFLALVAPGSPEADLQRLARRRLESVNQRIAGLTELRDGIEAYLRGEDFAEDEDCAAISRLMMRRRRAPGTRT